MSNIYLLEFDRKNCIAALNCTAVHPGGWTVARDGKAELVEGKGDAAKQTKEITEDDFARHLKAAQACPVNVIHIIRKKDNMQLI